MNLESYYHIISIITSSILATIAVLGYLSSSWHLKFQLSRTRNTGDVDRLIAKYIRRRIRRKYREYKAFIIIRYGSSINKKKSQPNDYDYYAFLIGYSKKENRKAHSEGDNFKFSRGKVKIYVDIEYRDYNSFLMSLAAGYFYEHGVVHKNLFIDGELGYYRWLKPFQQNLILNKKYLISELYNKTDVAYHAIQEDLTLKQTGYKTIRELYTYLTTYIQIDILQSFSVDKLNYKHITPFIHYQTLRKVLVNEEAKNVFDELMIYFKREATLPDNPENKIREIKDRISKLYVKD